jgi:MYXO-CTERM domain-containing protein
MSRLGTAAVVAALGVALASQDADACGCFAPPDPSVPIVQAGERILFSVQNGVVTAHIQIQYAGEAKDFGWLLPLPSVPTLKLGTEELFSQLINVTQPRYLLTTTTTGACTGFPQSLTPRVAGAATGETTNVDLGGSGEAPFTPLVIESSIGPYDYAVLRADRKDEMLQWLTDNGYFIPVGTDETVGPYIRPGAYFLALRLKSGQATGDIQPVVLEYPSDLPMIPIILTSVAAQPNMGIQVWMLGSGRAIPRNYNHVIINDSQVDWLGLAQNYNDVVIRAVSEAPDKHAFITEYAGNSSVMQDVLDGPGRFGSTAALGAITDPADFVEYLFENGYAPSANSSGGFGFAAPSLPPLLKSLVLAQIPFPEGLTSVTSEDNFLRQLRYYLGDYRTQHPAAFAGWTSSFDPSALAAQIEEKIVTPAKNAGALFRQHPYLTRLYTTLSPEDMTRDPVFSFNPSLPEVSRDHTATLRIDCGLGGDISTSPATLTTEQGWVSQLPNRNTTAPGKGPSALRIETLAEEGSPLVILDNGKTIAGKMGCGCSSVDPLFGAGLLALLVARRRRQRS